MCNSAQDNEAKNSPKSNLSLSVVLPPLAVALLMLAVYVIYSMNVIYPRIDALSPNPSLDPSFIGYTPTKNLTETVLFTIGFNILFILCLISFLRSIVTPPGSIPNLLIWKEAAFKIDPRDEERFRNILNDESFDITQPDVVEFIMTLPVVERKKKDTQYRFCAQCESYKPDRTHHCRICKQCILRMDHHCPWIANCVGFMNYKFFLLFLIYTVLACLYVVLTSFGRFYLAFRPVVHVGYFLLHDIPIIIVFITCVILFFAVGIFLSFHLYLTGAAMSTIELREKKNVQETKHRFNVAHMKFDRGFCGNIEHVFGPPYMWLFPIQPHTEIEGTYCPIPMQYESSVTTDGRRFNPNNNPSSGENSQTSSNATPPISPNLIAQPPNDQASHSSDTPLLLAPTTLDPTPNNHTMEIRNV